MHSARGQLAMILLIIESTEYLRHCEYSLWVVVELEVGSDVDVEAREK